MVKLKYILLFLLLPFTGQGQTVVNSFVHVSGGGGGGGWCAGAGFDTANAYIARVETYITPTTTQKNAVCSCYADLVSNGLMAGFKAAWIDKWGNSNANAIDMANPNGTLATYTGSPTFGSASTTYNGSTQRKDLKRTMSITGQNSGGIAINVVTAGGNFNAYMGAFQTGRQTLMYTGSGTSQMYASVNASSSSEQAHAVNTNGFLFLGRTSSTSEFMQRNGGTAVTKTINSTTQGNVNIWVGDVNNNGSPYGFPANFSTSFQAITDGYSSTNSATFYTIINTMLSSW